jgi:hypothetical protein
MLHPMSNIPVPERVSSLVKRKTIKHYYEKTNEDDRSKDASKIPATHRDTV